MPLTKASERFKSELKMIASVGGAAVGNDEKERATNLITYFDNLEKLQEDTSEITHSVEARVLIPFIDNEDNKLDELKIWHNAMLKLRRAVVNIKNIDQTNETTSGYIVVYPTLAKKLQEEHSTDIVKYCEEQITRIQTDITEAQTQLEKPYIDTQKQEAIKKPKLIRMLSWKTKRATGFDEKAHRQKCENKIKGSTTVIDSLEDCIKAENAANDAMRTLFDDKKAQILNSIGDEKNTCYEETTKFAFSKKGDVVKKEYESYFKLLSHLEHSLSFTTYLGPLKNLYSDDAVARFEKAFKVKRPKDYDSIIKAFPDVKIFTDLQVFKKGKELLHPHEPASKLAATTSSSPS